MNQLGSELNLGLRLFDEWGSLHPILFPSCYCYALTIENFSEYFSKCFKTATLGCPTEIICLPCSLHTTLPVTFSTVLLKRHCSSSSSLTLKGYGTAKQTRLKHPTNDATAGVESPALIYKITLTWPCLSNDRKITIPAQPLTHFAVYQLIGEN